MRAVVLVAVLVPVVAVADPAPEKFEMVVTVTTDSSGANHRSETNYTYNDAQSLHTEVRITATFEATASAGGWQSTKLLKLDGGGGSHSHMESHERWDEVDADHHHKTVDVTSDSTDTLDPKATKDGELTFVAGEGGIIVQGTLHFHGRTQGDTTTVDWHGRRNGHDDHADDAPSMFDFEGVATPDMIKSRHFTGRTVDNGDPRTNKATGSTTTTITTIDIHPLGPKVDSELVVEPAKYQDWIPEPGNPLQIKATFKPKTAGVKLSKLHVRLADVSQEPGTSLNDRPGAPAPDLGLTGGNAIGSNQQEIEFPFAHESESFTLFAADYGGWGNLIVTGDLSDGTTITGHLVGDTGKTTIEMPYRTGGSHIAEAWKKQNKVTGKSDDDDSDAPSIGKAGTPGDGFTLYEEYRGAQCGGAHVRLDPAKKDLFVRNEIGGAAKAGIQMLQDASSLVIHGCLTDDELPGSRVINNNHGQGAHTVDQHGIKLVVDDSEAGGVAEAIGTPGEVQQVAINSLTYTTNTLGQPAEDYNDTVAHELLHSLGVEHHGDEDQTPVKWEWTGEQLTEYGKTRQQITVEDEAGHAIGRHAADMDLVWSGNHQLDGEGTSPFSTNLLIQYPHGENSGDDNCIMNYAQSTSIMNGSTRVYVTIVVDLKRPTVRHLIKRHAPVGKKLCVAKKGTGVNAPGHAPLQWHGDATRGDCAHQFVVSDRYPIANHTAKKAAP